MGEIDYMKSILFNQSIKENLHDSLFKNFFRISGFPIWVSLLGIIFFEVIDRDEDGILEFSEISNYYKGLVGVKDEDLYVVAKEGYRALTAVRKIFFAHE